MLSGECHNTSLIISQHWFRQWLGAIRQQAIYLSQCWPRSLLPYGITRPQWVNLTDFFKWLTSRQKSTVISLIIISFSLISWRIELILCEFCWANYTEYHVCMNALKGNWMCISYALILSNIFWNRMPYNWPKHWIRFENENVYQLRICWQHTSIPWSLESGSENYYFMRFYLANSTLFIHLFPEHAFHPGAHFTNMDLF